MKKVLIDTSVWVSYFRQIGGDGLKEAVRDALLENRVTTCWVVQAELLVGARGKGDFERLNVLFSSLEHIPVDACLWEAASRLGFELRREGQTIPLPDLLIAQAAKAGESELWHADRHYEALSQRLGLASHSYL